MPKKLKRGEKYPDGFTQRQILLKLCEKDRTPTSEILDFLKDRFAIREQKNIREHHLKILEKQKLIRRESAGCGHPDYWSVISDFKVLNGTIERIKDYPRAHHDFMKSKYYRSWIPELVDALNCSFAEIGLTTIDITHAGQPTEYVEYHKSTIESDPILTNPPFTFSDSELKDITKALEYNWTMLRFIVYYLSTDNESKRELMLKLAATARSGTTYAARVTAVGFMSRFTREQIEKCNQKAEEGAVDPTLLKNNPDLVVMHKLITETNSYVNTHMRETRIAPSPAVTDQFGYLLCQLGASYNDPVGYATRKTIKVLTGYDINDLPIMWFAEWFANLDVVRHQYPFLFD